MPIAIMMMTTVQAIYSSVWHNLHLSALPRFFLMPDQQPASYQCHGLDQYVADNGDLDDAGEYAGGIGKAGCRHHCATETVSAHQHFRHYRDDQRKWQGHLQSSHDLRRRR